VAAPIAYTGIVKAGRFIPEDRAAFAKAFLRKDGTKMVVTVKQWAKTRSPNANAYWWKIVVGMFMEEMGIRDKEEMHHIILEQIGHYDLVRVGKKEIKVVKSTHDLPSNEFAVLIESAAQLFGEWFNGYLPPPGSAQAEAMGG
jgi:hypothetical protein